MSDIPFFSFDKRNNIVRAEVMKTFTKFFDSKWYVLGSRTSDFEKAYASFNETTYSVGVGSGLDALHLGLVALGIGEGDEVIVPSNTYIASVLSITYTGAIPIFVEPRYETANINPELIEAAITSRTKAIMPVHLYGQACEMGEIMRIATDRNLFVVEDNAQAHGARYKGKLTGSFGHINATSFYPTKNIGALGEAGAITTNDYDLCLKVRTLRNYGSELTYYNSIVGYNKRIDEFEAAYLSVALRYIQEWTNERMLIHDYYNSQLQGLKDIKLIQLAEGATTVNHLFTIRTPDRNDLQDHLRQKGIGTKIHYPVPPHMQECYKYLGYKNGDFPIAERIAKETLSLPNYLGLSKGQIDFVCKSVKEFYYAS